MTQPYPRNSRRETALLNVTELLVLARTHAAAHRETFGTQRWVDRADDWLADAAQEVTGWASRAAPLPLLMEAADTSGIVFAEPAQFDLAALVTAYAAHPLLPENFGTRKLERWLVGLQHGTNPRAITTLNPHLLTHPALTTKEARPGRCHAADRTRDDVIAVLEALIDFHDARALVVPCSDHLRIATTLKAVVAGIADSSCLMLPPVAIPDVSNLPAAAWWLITRCGTAPYADPHHWTGILTQLANHSREQ